MQTYEIRILSSDLRHYRVVTMNTLGNHAAVRRGQMLAQKDEFFEVWRGMTCVYSNVPEHALAS